MNKTANGISLIKKPIYIESVLEGMDYFKIRYTKIPKGVLGGIDRLSYSIVYEMDWACFTSFEVEKKERDNYCLLRIDTIVRQIAELYKEIEEDGRGWYYKASDLIVADLYIVDKRLEVLLKDKQNQIIPQNACYDDDDD